jgi:tRNA (cytidine/uridine-2'-O-)-methyltransferase
MGQLAKGFQVRPPHPSFGTDEDPDLHIALVTPEIPGNTGNIGRLCAGTDMWLHLIEPLGFDLDNKRLKRAGLDYWPHVKLCVHPSFEAFAAIFPAHKLHFFSKKGSRRYVDVDYKPGDVLVFGCETKGLSDTIMDTYRDQLTLIPKTDKVRSLNLSNAAAIAVYEAMRQLDFAPMHSDEP